MQTNISKGMELRILTVSPASEFLAAQTKSEKQSRGSHKHEIEQLIKWIRELKSLAPDSNKVEIRIYDSLPLDFYWRLDDIVLIGPYNYGETSQQTFTQAFDRGGLGFEYWEQRFDRLWNDSTFCSDALVESDTQ